MDCERAQELIDRRVDADGDEAGGRDWSELDAHLAKCPKCSARLLQLMRTRNLLADLAGDEPTGEETDKMWQAIQQAGPAGALVMQVSSVRKRVVRFVAACAGIAAVLMIALQLGRQHYDAPWAFVLDTPEAASAGGPVADQPPVAGRNLICPSSGQVSDSGSGKESLSPEELGTLQGLGYIGSGRDADVGGIATIDFSQLGRVSYHAYQVPSGNTADKLQVGDAEAGAGSIAATTYTPAVSLPSPPALPVPADGDNKRSALEEAILAASELMALPSRGQRMAPRKRSRRGRKAEPTAPALESLGYIGPADRRSVPPLPAEYGGSSGGFGAFGGGDTDALFSQEPTPPTAAQPKIVKTGEITLEVPGYDAAASQVETIVRQAGGFVADVAVMEQTGGALVGRIVIRVPPERFEALFAALKEVGRVQSENVKAADVTAQYVDLEARIRGLQITEQRLQELIKSKSFIDKIESLLEVEREMTRVRSQIEQYQGKLRVMANRVALSTITVTLREPARTVPAASMSVEVTTVAEAAESLGQALAKFGGRLRSGKTSKRSDGTLRGDYKLEVSLARFGELLAAIEGLGRVEGRQSTDRAFDDAAKPWADKVDCYVALVLYEPTRQAPRGTIKLEVGDLTAARRQLDEMLSPCGAAVMSSTTTRRGDGSSVGELQVRVSAGRFAELVESLGSLGRTVAKETAGQAGRIVGGAASLPCDITLTLSEPIRQVPSGNMTIEPEAFATARQQLSALIAEKDLQVLGSSSSQRTDGTWVGRFRLGIKAADMDSVVDRLESFGRVASRQITGIGLGDLSRIDPDALGVIELTLAEKAAIVPAPDRAGDSIRSRLREGLAGFYNSLGLIAFGLMAMAPWLIIVLVLAWVALRIIRRTRPVPASGTPTPKADD